MIVWGLWIIEINNLTYNFTFFWFWFTYFLREASMNPARSIESPCLIDLNYTITSGTSSPRSMIAVSCWPRSDPDPTSSRSRSPEDRWVNPYCRKVAINSSITPPPLCKHTWVRKGWSHFLDCYYMNSDNKSCLKLTLFCFRKLH